MNDIASNSKIEEFFTWDEKTYIEPSKKLENNGISVPSDIILDTKKNVTEKQENDIRKEKRKQYDKKWRLNNKEKIHKQQREWGLKNKEKIKEKNKNRYLKNKDKINKQNKEWRLKNKEKIKRKSKEWRLKNKEHIKEYHKKHDREYYLKNKEKIKKRKNKYHKNQLKTNINYKLTHHLRARACIALKKNYKDGSAVRDLGCTIPELKLYLESKFKLGMSWENWSREGWHIDHIKPLSKFNLSDRNQLLEACHYTNLQPLWAEENISKSDN